MKLYHGSYTEISHPDIKHSRDRLDFGKGFYITPLYEQAEKWSGKFKAIGKNGFVTEYTLDDKAMVEFKVKTFDTYSDEWLDFILSCRSGKDMSDYDIVIGGIANDKVFNTVELYFDGLIDKSEAIRRLRYEKPNLQICIRNQSVIDKCLHFEGSKKV